MNTSTIIQNKPWHLFFKKIFFPILLLILSKDSYIFTQTIVIEMNPPVLSLDIIALDQIKICWQTIFMNKPGSDFKIRIFRMDQNNEQQIAELGLDIHHHVDHELLLNQRYSYRAVFLYQDQKISQYSQPVSIMIPQPLYSFFTAGHTYGEPGIVNQGLHPPFEAQFDYINQIPYLFSGFLTGDIVIRSTPEKWENVFEKTAQLNVPIFYAFGNHDYKNLDCLLSIFPATYQSFVHEHGLFIILDSEAGPHNIEGDQLIFLQDTLKHLQTIRHIFVFMHKLIWIADDTIFSPLKYGINSTHGYNFNSNFWTEIEPLFHSLAQQVYFIAGDLGTHWAIPAFYHQQGNLHFIASGMGGNPEENYLIFHVTESGLIIEMKSLQNTLFRFPSIKDYNLANWEQFKPIPSVSEKSNEFSLINKR